MFFSVIRTLLAGGHIDIQSVIAQVLALIFVIVCILPLHELAHGWVAYRLGDPTAKLERRLTLNPLASVDPIGTVWLFLLALAGQSPCQWTQGILKSPNGIWP